MNEQPGKFIIHRSSFITVCGQACKPDSVGISPDADGHFSAATIARSVTKQVSPLRSNQPENSTGRVFPKKPSELRFLLGFAPRKGCRALRHRKTGRLIIRPFQPYPPPEGRERNAFCCPVSPQASPPAWSPLATALPCGVRTFLTTRQPPAARPSSLSRGNYTSPTNTRIRIKSRICWCH